MNENRPQISKTRHIEQGNDGIYRWVYELKLLKNPVILFTVWKILVGIFVGIWLLITLLSAGDKGFWFNGFWKETKGFLLLIMAILLLSTVAYLGYALVMGGKYCVLFEMDEKGVRHTQVPKQFSKAQVLSLITILSGVAAENVGTIGTGLLSGSRQSMYSEWATVKSIGVYPRRNLIKVNALLNKNQVYVEDDDFEFVRQYIRSHCQEAKYTNEEEKS